MRHTAKSCIYQIQHCPHLLFLVSGGRILFQGVKQQQSSEEGAWEPRHSSRICWVSWAVTAAHNLGTKRVHISVPMDVFQSYHFCTGTGSSSQCFQVRNTPLRESKGSYILWFVLSRLLKRLVCAYVHMYIYMGTICFPCILTLWPGDWNTGSVELWVQDVPLLVWAVQGLRCHGKGAGHGLDWGALSVKMCPLPRGQAHAGTDTGPSLAFTRFLRVPQPGLLQELRPCQMVPDGAELSVGILSISLFGIARTLPGSFRGSQCCWNGLGRLPVPSVLGFLMPPQQHQSSVTGERGMWSNRSGVIFWWIFWWIWDVSVSNVPERCCVTCALLHSGSF